MVRIKYVSKPLKATDPISKNIVIALDGLFCLDICVKGKGTNFVFEGMRRSGSILCHFGLLDFLFLDRNGQGLDELMMLKRFVAVRGEEDGLVMCFCVDSPADFAEGGAEIEVI